MGVFFSDQYSILHFAVGVIMYFWNINIYISLLIHTIFEIVENTEYGMYLINTLFIHPGFFSWPGGKNYADYTINKIGDTFYFAIGWLISAILDFYSVKNV